MLSNVQPDNKQLEYYAESALQIPTVANVDKADPPNLFPLVKGLGLSKEGASVSIHFVPILVSVVATVGSYNAFS